MLFSEPKIPQCSTPPSKRCKSPCFSALQRAENSSMITQPMQLVAVLVEFQCSSASRKFLNRCRKTLRLRCWTRFQCSSASRKFLNPDFDIDNGETAEEFQCSSASRKFLNLLPTPEDVLQKSRFSALQRAENSSIVEGFALFGIARKFQCSSASRKFLNDAGCVTASRVSRFQCSSASRKFLNRLSCARSTSKRTFQCSSASRKFLNTSPR